MGASRVKHLTHRQAQVLSFIMWRRKFTHPVTLQLIGAHFGMGKGPARDHVVALERKGCVTWDKAKAGTIMPVKVKE